MDFLKILRSLDELLYEVITWLFFYPRTLWRVLMHPLKMIDYTSYELTKEEGQFKDTISPPLFLILTLILLYGFSLVTHNQAFLDNPTQTGDIGRIVFGSTENMLMFRSLSYSVWSLIFSLGLLNMQRISIDRETLRAPFFSQCFLIAPYALGVTFAFVCTASHTPALQILGIILLLASWLWYMVIQVKYIVKVVNISYLRAVIHTILYFSFGCILSYIVIHVTLNN
ncbi:MAG: hypothetical protein ABS939_20725 [Psychrobacillus sp.]